MCILLGITGCVRGCFELIDDEESVWIEWSDVALVEGRGGWRKLPFLFGAAALSGPQLSSSIDDMTMLLIY